MSSLPLTVVAHVLVFLVIFCPEVESTLADERAAQVITVKLYEMSKSKWSSTLESTFQTVVSTQATSYCTANLATCGLDTASTFTSSEVVVSGQEDDSKSMEMSVNIDFPSGAAITAGHATQFVLQSSVVSAILSSAKDTIKSDLDVYLTYIGNDFYGIPPDKQANAIIIPLSIATVIAIAILAICLVKWTERKERADLLNKRREKKKESVGYGTTSANNNNIACSSNNTLENTHSTVVTTTTPRHGQGSSLGPVSSLNNFTVEYDGQKTSGAGAAVYKESPRSEVHFQPHANYLAPLNTSKESKELSEEEQEKRRRKKEKRRERKQKQRLEDLEGQDNQAMDSSNLTVDSTSEVPTFSAQKLHSMA